MDVIQKNPLEYKKLNGIEIITKRKRKEKRMGNIITMLHPTEKKNG